MTVSTEVTRNESDTYRQEGHMKTGQDTLELPAAGRGRGAFFPKASRGSVALQMPLFCTNGFQNFERINFSFKPTNVW